MTTKMAFLLLAGMGTAAPAWAETYTCDNCTSAQIKQMADKKLIANGRPAREQREYLYIADVAQGKAYKWQYNVKVVTVPGSGDGDTTQITAWTSALTVESDVANGIAKVKLALKSGRDIYDTTGTNMPSTIYTSIEQPSFEKNINDRLKATSPGLAQSLVDLSALLRSGFQSRGVIVSVNWHYPDGSVATFVYDPSTQLWKRDPTSGFDKDNNPVPITRIDYSGGDGSTRSYSFSQLPSGYEEFIRHARNVGVTFTTGTQREAGYIAAVTCATSDGKTTCRVQLIQR